MATSLSVLAVDRQRGLRTRVWVEPGRQGPVTGVHGLSLSGGGLGVTLHPDSPREHSQWAGRPTASATLSPGCPCGGVRQGLRQRRGHSPCVLCTHPSAMAPLCCAVPFSLWYPKGRCLCRGPTASSLPELQRRSCVHRFMVSAGALSQEPSVPTRETAGASERGGGGRRERRRERRREKDRAFDFCPKTCLFFLILFSFWWLISGFSRENLPLWGLLEPAGGQPAPGSAGLPGSVREAPACPGCWRPRLPTLPSHRPPSAPQKGATEIKNPVSGKQISGFPWRDGPPSEALPWESRSAASRVPPWGPGKKVGKVRGN